MDNSFFVGEILRQTHYVNTGCNRGRNHGLSFGLFFLVAFLRIRNWFLLIFAAVPFFDDVYCTLYLERSKFHHQGDRHEQAKFILHCLEYIAITSYVRLQIGLIVVENQVYFTFRRGKLLQKR